MNVPVFTIGLGTEMDEAVLSQAAEATGAAYLNAPDATELGGVYDRIGAQLSGQYSIRCTSSLPADGNERRVGLEAPQGQGSKSYTPSGDAADALSGARVELEEIASLHEDDLISAVDYTGDWAELTRPAEDAAQGSQESYDCLVAAETKLNGLHDDELVTSVTVNGIRGDLADSVGG